MDKLSDEEILKDYFTKSVFKINFNKMSNSLCLIFYLQNNLDFKEFWESIKFLED